MRYTSQLSKNYLFYIIFWIITRRKPHRSLYNLKSLSFAIFFKLENVTEVYSTSFPWLIVGKSDFLSFNSFKWIFPIHFTNQFLFIWSSKLNWNILAALSWNLSYNYIFIKAVFVYTELFFFTIFTFDKSFSGLRGGTFRNRGKTICKI